MKLCVNVKVGMIPMWELTLSIISSMIMTIGVVSDSRRAVYTGVVMFKIILLYRIIVFVG